MLKLTNLVLLGMALGAALAFSAANTSAQSGPSPTAGARLVGGLLNPKGVKIGPDGMLYVAESGTGGDITPADPHAGKSGFTGRISRIDPVTGARTTVADKLPSNAGVLGVEGPADVAFIGGQLYYLQGRGGEFFGFPDNPTGVYRVNKDGTAKLVADITMFNVDHPIGDSTKTSQQDIEAGAEPAAMAVRDGAFLVAEGASVGVANASADQVLKITTGGAITRLAEFRGNLALSSIATNETGPLYVTGIGPAFLVSDGAVYQVGYPTGSITKIAGGFSAMDDVKAGPGGQLYALSFGDFSPDGPGLLGSGKVFRLDAVAGTLTPIVTGFTAPTKFIFLGDNAYVVNHGQSGNEGAGEIWKIDNVSSLKALPAPEPTKAAAPPTTTTRSVIAAPNTGTGDTADRGSWFSAMLVVGIAGVALAVAGTRDGRVRRQSNKRP
jgi:hypothetical protein